MKRCPMCGSSGVEKVWRNYRMRESGLDYLVVEDAEFYLCSSCGEEVFSVPMVGPLMNLVADLIVCNGRALGAQEVRFLRKWLVGRNFIPEGAEGRFRLSNLLCGPSILLEQVEEGRKCLPRAQDRLLRILVASYLSRRPWSILKAFEAGQPYSRVLRVKHTNGIWHSVSSS